MVTPDHALFPFLLEHGLTQDELLWFEVNRCPPSILGLNYYVTSDRFLDHRLELYPPRAGGDTGEEPFVDIEAVRVRVEGIAGARSILRQAWQRYKLPLAITEAHLGSEPLEQIRWLSEIWRDAEAVRADGADVRAVTAWSLMGAFNWCHLCARDTGTYEAGVFDLKDGTPKETLLTDLVRCITQHRPPTKAALEEGWWRKTDRITVPWPGVDAPAS